MARLLVTGGAGFVGSHVVKQLLQAGHDVVVLDNLSTGHREAVRPPVELVVGDLADEGLLRELFSGRRFDGVLHFAAHSLVGESVTAPLKYFQNNVAHGVNLLKVMLEHGVRHFVFSSTAAVYGEPQVTPIPESHPLQPVNPYGESKLMVERMLARCAEAYGLRYAALRYFNAAGADPDGKIGEDHNPETHLIPLVLRVALGQSEQIRVFGTDYNTPDGTCIRDYIDVSDLASAHLLAFTALQEGQALGAYNLGNGRGFSVREVIRAAEAVTGRTIAVQETERRAGDPAVLVASSERARSELGWRPVRTDLEQIIATAWEWHRTHPQGYAKGE